MNSNMRPTSDHTNPQAIVVQDQMHEFRPVTQARVLLAHFPTRAHYQLHLVVPASVRITPYHTSRKCMRDGFFDIEVAPIPGSSAVYGLKVCLGWDASLHITHRQQQAPSAAIMTGTGLAVQQTGVQTASQADRGMPMKAPAVGPSASCMSMPTSQTTPTTNGGSRTPNNSANGNGQSHYMYQQPSIAAHRPVNGGAAQQAMPNGLFSTPPFPGHPYVPTPPVPMPSASKAGGQFHGNRPGPHPQQRQYSTGRPTQSTPTPVAPGSRRHARTAVPTPSHTNLGQNTPANTTSNYICSADKKRFSSATPTRVAKSSPYHSSTKQKVEMHQKASRVLKDLSSKHESIKKADEPSTFKPSEPFQDISTPQAAFFANTDQQVIEMQSSTSAPPSLSSSTLQGTSTTAEALTTASEEDLRVPADEEMVPLGEDDDLFGEGSETGNDHDDDPYNGTNVNAELEGTQSPFEGIEQPNVQETQPGQPQAVEQNGQVQASEEAFNESASGNFTTGTDSSQGFDPTFDPNTFDLDSNMEYFNPAGLSPEDMMLFPGLFSPKNQSPYDG